MASPESQDESRRSAGLVRKFREWDIFGKLALYWVVGCVAVFALMATANESPLGLVLFASPFVAFLAFWTFWIGVAILGILVDTYQQLGKMLVRRIERERKK